MSRRLGIIVSHPIQYQVPLYRFLANNTGVVPYVLFLTDHGVSGSYDPGFGRSILYDVPLLDGYDYRFLPNRSPWPSVGTPWGVFNPGLPIMLRQAGLDALLVHGWSHISSWLAFAASRLLGVPYLLRGDTQPDADDGPRLKTLVKHAVVGPLVRGAGACLAIGSRNRDFYLDYGAKPACIFDAPYCVDTERFERAGQRGRACRAERLTRLGLDPRRPVVLFAAKLQPWKRPLDAVDAVDRFVGSVNLIVIGDGPLRAQVDEAARSRPWMRSLGFVNQTAIAEWYGVADFFVLPSEHEQWGLAVNEAMAAGAVPIVSEAVGCHPDLVTPDTGWVHPVGDVGALAAAIGSGIRAGQTAWYRRAAKLRSREWGVAETAAGICRAVDAVAGR